MIEKLQFRSDSPKFLLNAHKDTQIMSVKLCVNPPDYHKNSRKSGFLSYCFFI